MLSPESWCAHGFVCALQESVSPVLAALCGVNGNLLEEGLCHTQVYCTQSPCPCSSPLLTHTSTGDTQTQFYLSLCGVSGSWCPQGLFEPTEHLSKVWGLILNMILPLLLPFWGFSFALGHGLSLQSHSRPVQLLLQRYAAMLQHLPSCWGFSALGHGVSSQSHSNAMQPPLQCPLGLAKFGFLFLVSWSSALCLALSIVNFSHLHILG